ncbi:hypothetical protein MF271_23115 (plasmid) [Deinococcus sp. KNUC1210]|uniref:hypothetical protein n=1 Tax=Deinococcus sp. KNUC1210 TaxID=2917691 RepID=UPI001EEF839C|nr:hypothetical protein [Deinococcus sp. KNUC1210]ULH18351.1 hypothetical protein MF271_23115 [Deinococcus sp. KNUC1210]
MSLFTSSDSWLGEYFELALDLGPKDDDKLRAAWNTLWSSERLNGIYLHHQAEPEDQEKEAAESFVLDNHSAHVYAVAKVSSDISVPAHVIIVREEAGNDWLYVSFPSEIIGEIFKWPPDSYPIGDLAEHLRWMCQIESWFTDLAQEIFASVKFEMGLIGFEIAGWPTAESIRRDGVPEKRQIGYLFPENERLIYFPRTVNFRG